MENILKKWNSKWFLLFLFTFFSVGMQAQWDEDTDGDGTLDWVEDIWDASPDGENSTWTFEDGSIIEAHSTTMDELQADYESYASIYGEGSTASQIGTVYNANGTIAASFGFGTAAMIGGPYLGGFNANGVLRVYVGNADLPTGPSPAPGWLGTVTILPIYNYYFPDGTVTTSYNPSDSNIVLTNITTITSVGVTSTQTIIQSITPTLTGGDCYKSPVPENTKISSLFMSSRDCNVCSKTHGGTDYAVPTGTPIKSSASGVVARSYFSNTYGNVVIVDHGISNIDNDHVYTLYAHGSSRIVNQGDVVKEGDNVIYSGNTGNSTGPHLHYEIIKTSDSPFNGDFFKGLDKRYGPDELKYIVDKNCN